MLNSEMCSPGLAPGMKLLHLSMGKRFRYPVYQWLALVLTFLVYMAYHASRRPLTIVKPVLHLTEATSCDDDGDEGAGLRATADVGEDGSEPKEGWEPFIGTAGERRLGFLDTAFLVSYSFGVLVAGHIGDRTNLRHFLLFGMLGSGVMVCFAGMAYFWYINEYSYFLVFQTLSGAFEATGWPVVVAVVAQWFGKGRRGLIMGIWNSHTSVGNMLGSFMAASVVNHGWGYSFVVLGVFIGGMGILVWLFLVVSPSEVNYSGPQDGQHPRQHRRLSASEEVEGEEAISAGLLEPDSQEKHPQKGISFVAAWMIPGVAQFSFALFFSKLVAYTFLFWLPYYLKACRHNVDAQEAGDLSILFDVGGIFGGIAAGLLSDMTRAHATVATSFTVLSVPTLWAYRVLGGMSGGINNFLLLVSGFFVNGPYALITTAVSADLGTHESIAGNHKALSTVTAIIDGMGSLGAALGPTVAGQIIAIPSKHNYDRVFMMLGGSSFMAGLLLVGLVLKELKGMRRRQPVPAPGERESDSLLPSESHRPS